MRRLLVVSLWVVATVGVTYVASAAVALVDLQVFPQGERVEVLTRPAPPPTTTILPTSTTSGGSTNLTTVPAATVPAATVPATTVPAPTVPATTVPATTVESSSVTTTVALTPSTMVVPATTTVSDAGGEEAPTTTRPPTTTTTRPVPPLAIDAVDLTVGTVGSAYGIELVATGGQRPHIWQIAAGVLPPGLALSSAGRISGTPQGAGQFSFSVRVSDGSGRLASASLVLTTLNSLRVLTTSLPEVEAGSAYQATLQATGGTPPYRWTVVDGGLPDGLVLTANGVVSGTSSGGSPTSVVAAATDSSGRVAHSGGLSVVFAADRRTVAARGGTVFVDVLGDSVSLFLASPADGFSAIVVESGGFRVEVQFVPLQGDATSWVVCEVAGEVACSHG
jgi:hypothetical protein